MEQSRTRSLSDGRVVPVEDSVRGKRQVWVDRGPGRPDHGPDNQGPGVRREQQQAEGEARAKRCEARRSQEFSQADGGALYWQEGLRTSAPPPSGSPPGLCHKLGSYSPQSTNSPREGQRAVVSCKKIYDSIKVGSGGGSQRSWGAIFYVWSNYSRGQNGRFEWWRS